MYQHFHHSKVMKIFHGFSLDPWMDHLDFSTIAYLDYLYLFGWSSFLELRSIYIALSWGLALGWISQLQAHWLLF